MMMSFDVLEAKLTEPGKCNRCGKVIKPGIRCILMIPSHPLEPVKEVVGKVEGYAFHVKCYEEFWRELVSECDEVIEI